jgi:hypothetical protein
MEVSPVPTPGDERPAQRRRHAMPFNLIDKLEELAEDLPDRAQDALDRVLEILGDLDHLP